MTSLTLALAQVDAVPLDPDANLKRGLDVCASAAGAGADLVVFPEIWQLGYAACPTDPDGRRRWNELATTTGGPWVSEFAEAAREHGVAVLATYLQRAETGPRNAATLIDRRGREVLTYAKVHTCDFGWEGAMEPGDGFRVAQLETREGNVNIGVMICYDREFPESARLLMLGGAELILTPNACDLTNDRVGQFRARAYENMTAVAMANYPEFGGRSCAFSGMAFTRDGEPVDHTIVEAGADEELVIATIDIGQLRAYRSHETWGDSYRKPHAYAAIASIDPPREPFIRDNSRRDGQFN